MAVETWQQILVYAANWLASEKNLDADLPIM